MGGEVNVGTLEATLSILAETDSLEAMDRALQDLESQLGVTREAVLANEQALSQTEELGRATEVALNALGISLEQYNTILEQNRTAAEAAAAEMDKFHLEALKMNEAFDNAGDPIMKFIESLVGGGSLKSAFEALMELPAGIVLGITAIEKGIEMGMDAIKEFGEAVRELGEKAKKLENKSLILGVDVETLQKWSRAAEIAGGSVDSLQMVIIRLQRAVETNSKSFRQLGVSVKDFKAMETAQQVEFVAEKLMSMSDAGERNNLMFSLLGRGAARQLPLLKAIAEGAGDAAVIMGKDTVEATEELNRSLELLGGAWADMKEQMVLAVMSGFPEGKGIIEDFTLAIRRMAEIIKGDSTGIGQSFRALLNHFTGGAVELAIKNVRDLADAQRRLNVGKETAESVAKAEEAVKKLAETMEEAEKTHKDTIGLGAEEARTQKAVAAATKEHENAARDAAKALREKEAAVKKEIDDGQKTINSYIKQREENDKVADVITKNAEKEIKSIEDGMEATRVATELEVYAAERASRASDAHAKAVAKQALEMAKASLAAARFGSLMSGIADLGAALGGSFEVAAQMAGNIGDGVKNLQALNEKMAQAKSPAEAAAIAHEQFVGKVGMGAAAASALGGALEKSKNPMMAQAGAALQAGAAGAKMGAAFGPIGAIIGGVGGAIMGFINKGKQLKAEVTKLYDEFVKSAGGMDQLEKQAKEAGVSLEEVFKNKGTKNVQAMKDAIEKVNKGLEAHQKLLDDAKEGSDKLSAAMEKYGITIEQLGPKFRQQKLDEMAKPLLEDWTLLAQAGVDINVLIEKFGPKMDESGKIIEENGKLMIGNMNEYINTAVRAGATIPEAMKPAIDALYSQGKLVHENGEAFTQAEYEALKYGKSQEEMFTSLIDKITQLVNAMLGIPTDVNTTVTTTHVDRSAPGGGGGGPRNDDGTPDYDGDPTNSFRGGSRGFRNFGAGTRAVLHGIERVQTQSQVQAEQADIAGAIAEAVAEQTVSLSKAFRDAVIRGV